MRRELAYSPVDCCQFNKQSEARAKLVCVYMNLEGVHQENGKHIIAIKKFIHVRTLLMYANVAIYVCLYILSQRVLQGGNTLVLHANVFSTFLINSLKIDTLDSIIWLLNHRV